MVGNFIFLFNHAGGSDFRLCDSSYLKTYLLMRWYGPDALAVSALFTVESLSLLYLLVIT